MTDFVLMIHFRIHLLELQQRVVQCFKDLELDMQPYSYEVFGRKKREYMKEFKEIASEVPDLRELYGIVYKSEELFLNLVQVMSLK